MTIRGVETEDREARWMGANSPDCAECHQPVHAGDDIYTTTTTQGRKLLSWSIRHRGCDSM